MSREVGGRYRLIEPLGEGGMGVVWRAHDRLLDRTVAVKEVRYTGVGDDKRADLNRRTIREARAAGRLDHPSVVVIHDVVEEDGRPWIVMQLVPSRSLAQVLAEQGPLPVERVALIGERVLGALRAAHATGVLHRDVKPENVLLAHDGRVVLTDFGIATLDAEPGLTATGGLVGTPAYMPPERLNGEPARPESDLWSLGATLYAAVEGAPAYRRDSWAATVAAVLRDDPAPPVRAGALTPVIMGLMRRHPAARMPAGEAAHLLGAIASAPAPSGRTVPVSASRVRPPARRRLMVPAAIVLAAVLAAGGTLLAVRANGLLGGDGGSSALTGPTGRATPTPTATATATGKATGPARRPTATPEPSATATQGENGVAVPAGWRAYRNAEGGFSMAVPRGWTVVKSSTRDSVTVRGPGVPGAFIVEWTVPEGAWPGPVRHWQGLEKEILGRGEFPGYRRIAIEPTTFLGRPAADWEYTWRRDGAIVHVLNRGFRTADGRPYALYWEAPDSRWSRDRRYFDTFTGTFAAL
ncbi:serine/threonine-protein kinase [Nonomuraea rhodomycinica]|uniref:non-specific serine/threonine protein kinase n=1 Tax=Nonomuraea rhodomycinica TaxID=1712872 RepID=A0A7Y6IKE7_9ACTN|nr:serine/threonine-protein kinase [Nonomuraea rhodomycinica]NUW39855.1 serine/threonine protein kinase [Nonomuraea rhodomycinica]